MPSPLRCTVEDGPLPSMRMQLGDARYLARPSNLDGAALEWLQAWTEADRPAVAAGIEDRLLRGRPRRKQAALLHLHLACYTPDFERARVALSHAFAYDAKTERVLERMLAFAESMPRYFAAHAHLGLSFSGLTRQALTDQGALFARFDNGDWAGMAVVAENLVGRFPQLLPPRCLQFVGRIKARGDGHGGGDVAQDVSDAHAVMDFVRSLDARGHFHAQGTAPRGHFRQAWSMFLQAWYTVEPLAFGARHDDAGRLVDVSPRRRFVAGLPWLRARLLPFQHAWDDEVAAWRREVAGATDDNVPASGSEAAATRLQGGRGAGGLPAPLPSAAHTQV